MRSTATFLISQQRKIRRGHQLATKEDIARLEPGTKGEFGRLAAEIKKRPTRGQTIADAAMIAGLIGALITLGTRLAR
jgi:hypothetical protein